MRVRETAKYFFRFITNSSEISLAVFLITMGFLLFMTDTQLARGDTYMRQDSTALTDIIIRHSPYMYPHSLESVIVHTAQEFQLKTL